MCMFGSNPKKRFQMDNTQHIFRMKYHQRHSRMDGPDSLFNPKNTEYTPAVVVIEVSLYCCIVWTSYVK